MASAKPDVGELRGAGDHVADRPHARLVGPLVAVGDHEAPLVDHAPPCPPSTSPSVRGRRPTETTTMSDVDLGSLGRGAGRRRCRSDRGTNPFTWAPVCSSMPRLRNDRCDDRGDLGVAPGEDRVECLDEGDPRTEVGQERCELAPDGAGTDDRRPTRGCLSRSKNSSEVTTATAVDRQSGQRAGHRPGGQDDVAADDLGPRVGTLAHPYPPVRQQGAGTRQHGDLAALQETRRGPGRAGRRPRSCDSG